MKSKANVFFLTFFRFQLKTFYKNNHNILFHMQFYKTIQILLTEKQR